MTRSVSSRKKQRDVRNVEGFLNHAAHAGQQLLQIHHGGALLGDGVDGFQLPGALAFERYRRAFCSAIEACVENRVRSSMVS